MANLTLLNYGYGGRVPVVARELAQAATEYALDHEDQFLSGLPSEWEPIRPIETGSTERFAANRKTHTMRDPRQTEESARLWRSTYARCEACGANWDRADVEPCMFRERTAAELAAIVKAWRTFNLEVVR